MKLDVFDAVYLAVRSLPVVAPTPEEKALLLLLRHLTVEQQKQVTTVGYFDVPIRGDVLRFHNVQHGFLEEVKKQRAWCAFSVAYFPHSVVPAADETLTKKLLYEANPRHLFEIANPMDIARAYLAYTSFFAPGYRPERY